MIVIVIGVSGSGKTTVGRLLAGRLRWLFLDADDFHSPENVARMRQGIPLTDADRAGWLAALAACLRATTAQHQSAVLACSALKQSYRDQLAEAGGAVRFVYLAGDHAMIAARLAERRGHYMSPGLLASQFATLEEPADALRLDASDSPDQLVGEIIKQLGLCAA